MKKKKTRLTSANQRPLDLHTENILSSVFSLIRLACLVWRHFFPSFSLVNFWWKIHLQRRTFFSALWMRKKRGSTDLHQKRIQVLGLYLYKSHTNFKPYISDINTSTSRVNRKKIYNSKELIWFDKSDFAKKKKINEIAPKCWEDASKKPYQF